MPTATGEPCVPCGEAPLPCVGPGHGIDYKVGTSIPANTPHAVSVSLPLWSDNVDYEEGRLSKVMECGYPRFFVARNIQKLAKCMCLKFAQQDEDCFLFPSRRIADRCRAFMQRHYSKQTSSNGASSSLSGPLAVRIVHYSFLPDAGNVNGGQTSDVRTLNLYVVLFPKHAGALAKAYWQHTGDGVTSRFADRCLELLTSAGKLTESSESVDGQSSINGANPATGLSGEAKPVLPRTYSRNRHYSRGVRPASSPVTPITPTFPQSMSDSITSLTSSNGSDTESGSHATTDGLHTNGAAGAGEVPFEALTADQSFYVEERYGRNLPSANASLAKSALRRRIAGTLLSDQGTEATKANSNVGPTVRSGTSLSEHDVWLFSCGMSAIFHAHQAAMLMRAKHLRQVRAVAATVGEKLSSLHVDEEPEYPIDFGSDTEVGKSACFGFPYTDTLKILQKWGPGCHFFGKGSAEELDDLEALLNAQVDSDEAPLLALFCEFPSNPLLRCPDLKRLRDLANKHGFLIVIDETIGNFLNVEVMPYADMVVSSLTKLFSGDANVMGGSLVLNPHGPHAPALREALEKEYEDNFWREDAVFLERNSRDFACRSIRVNENAEALADMLYSLRSIERPGSVVKDVFYPKYVTRENYDICRREAQLIPCAAAGDKQGTSQPEGGFGGLFTVTFTSLLASQVFYDSLRCAKGPSLGTNFTLASPYAVLAHYTELDWAAQYDVDAGLVRVSTGLEETKELVDMFRDAVQMAQKAVEGDAKESG